MGPVLFGREAARKLAVPRLTELDDMEEDTVGDAPLYQLVQETIRRNDGFFAALQKRATASAATTHRDSLQVAWPGEPENFRSASVQSSRRADFSKNPRSLIELARTVKHP
jgi:hypothetical protein